MSQPAQPYRYPSGARPQRGLTVASLTCLALLAAASAFAQAYAGRRVSDVLEELVAGGMTLIFNDELVPPDLRVLGEPEAPGGEALAAEVLAPHGLALESLGNGAFAVVRIAGWAPGGAATDGPRLAAPPPRPLEEIVVTTSQYGLAYEEPGSRTFLTQQEVESLPRLGDETLRAVHRLPGAASNGLSGLAHIRGGEESETLILLDGLPLFEPFHLKNFLSPVSVLDSRVIESLDVNYGGFSANLGDRMSAVVEAESLAPPENRYYELGLSLFHTSALASQSFAGERGSWLVSLRRSNLDEIADVANSDVGELRYFDAFARLRYELTADTRLGLSLLFSDDAIKANNSAKTELADADYRNRYIWITLEHDWSDALTGRVITSFTHVDNDRDGSVDEPGERIGFVDDRRDYQVAALRTDLSWDLGDWLHRFGVEAKAVQGSYDYASARLFAPGFPFPGDPGSSLARDSDLEPDGAQYAAWWTSRVRVGDRWTLEAGLRWDDETYSDVGDGELAPRVSLLYEFDDLTRLRASWGRFYQAQGINELQVEDGVERFFEAQLADHTILSLERDLPRDVVLRVEAYYKNYDRLRPRYENLFDPLVLLPELEPDRVEVAPGDATVRGVELLLARRADSPWSWWLSYAWSRAVDKLDGQDVARSWDQRHTVNAGLNWRGEHWDLTLADTYHTGWPTTRAQLELVDGEPFVRVGPRNDARFNDFNSLDFRASRRFELERGELVAFFELTNLLARRNECCVEYQVKTRDDGSFYLDEDLDYWPRFIPGLGVLWKF